MVETRAIGGDSPSGGPPLPKTVYRLGWVSGLTDVSSEMIVPLLPSFLATLSGAPAAALGWIEGVADATASFAKILSGKWADRAKTKKPLVFFGYGLSSLARPLIGIAPGWATVVVIRFFDRIGKGVRGAPRDAMLAAAAPPGRRGAAFGLHRAFDNGGAVFGPLIAAGLVGWLGLSFRLVFLLAAIPAALSLGVLWFGVKERSEENEDLSSSESKRTGADARVEGAGGAAGTGASPFEGKTTVTPAEAPHAALGSVAKLPSAFWRTAAVLALFALAASSDTFLLLKAKEVGIAAAWLPVVWAFSNAVKSAFSTWGGGLSDRFGRKTLLFSAWTLYAGCYAGFAFVTSAAVLVALIGVYSLHYALSEGTERALVADLVPQPQRGRAFGWMHGLTGFAALPASLGFGLVWERAGSTASFLLGAGIAAAAAACLVFLVPRPPRAG